MNILLFCMLTASCQLTSSPEKTELNKNIESPQLTTKLDTIENPTETSEKQ